MSSEVELLTPTTLPTPPQYFLGVDRVYVAIWYISISSVSLLLHIVFIAGSRRLCGWQSDFSFTLLCFNASVSMIRFVVQIFASITALFYLDWNKYQDLFIVYGSLAFTPYFTVVFNNFAITIHRLIYTAYPFAASSILNKSVTKTILAISCGIFLFFLLSLNTQLMGARWVDSMMAWGIMKSRNVHLFRALNTITNYAVGLINLVCYSALFFILYIRKAISFRRNNEIKMTLQVMCMVTCEFLFFLFWELLTVTNGGVLLVFAETTNLLYFDAIILPYLILNG
ncbi:hypothetical protein Q1695_002364 [Nippostrongylus brasiliensis]|nr:hypothetical protein Q1695_002364 [Nippostrongylus brasiliensis]